MLILFTHRLEVTTTTTGLGTVMLALTGRAGITVIFRMVLLRLSDADNFALSLGSGTVPTFTRTAPAGHD